MRTSHGDAGPHASFMTGSTGISRGSERDATHQRTRGAGPDHRCRLFPISRRPDAYRSSPPAPRSWRSARRAQLRQVTAVREQYARESGTSRDVDFLWTTTSLRHVALASDRRDGAARRNRAADTAFRPRHRQCRRRDLPRCGHRCAVPGQGAARGRSTPGLVVHRDRPWTGCAPPAIPISHWLRPSRPVAAASCSRSASRSSCRRVARASSDHEVASAISSSRSRSDQPPQRRKATRRGGTSTAPPSAKLSRG